MPYWDWDYPGDDDVRRDRGRRARVGGAARARVRGSGAAAPARRRAGRLLSERRHRLVRRARLRVAAVAAAAARVHAVVRSRGLRRERDLAARTGAALGRRVLPRRHPLRAPGRSFRRRDLSRRAAVRERARRREVPAEPRGARLGHQGRADRRRQRRDLRGLSALPPRPRAVRRQRPRRPTRRRGCSPSSKPPIACRPGTLLPQGTTTLDSVQRVLGFVPSNLESVGADRRRACCAWRATSFRRALRGARHRFASCSAASTSSASSRDATP